MAEVLSIELQAKITNFVNGMKTAASVTKNTEDKITKSTKSISNAVTSNLTGIFSIAAVAGFAKAVFQVTAEFQKFNAVLGNTLGSASLASIKLREIQDFASKTPFGIQELTSAFVKLANSGFKPTGDQMRSLGDLASSTGKSFDQLAEAILDAQTGEFERLKEFGIRAKDAGDSVIFTYKGVQTQVEKTSDAIRDYITNLGNAEGVSGSMAKISETLGGQISNLGDNWDKMLLSVGSNTTGVFNSSISVISKAIDKITQYNEELSIAEKNNLGSDFFQQLNRAVNPFAGKGATDKELGVGLIKEATKEVGAFISKATQGAKSSKDFGKAMAELSEKSKLALTSPAIRSENVRKGIYDAFREGVIAIDDARKAFENSGDLKSGNFGTAKAQKGVKSLADVLKELEQELDVTNTLFKSTFDERNEAQITAYTKAIETTTKAFGSQSKIVQDLISKRNALFQLPQIKTGTALDPKTAPRNRQANDKGVIFERVVGDIGSIGRLSKEDQALAVQYATILEKQDKFNEEFKKGFENLQSASIAEAIGGGFSAIGEAMVSGGNIIEAAGSALMGTLSQFLNELGGMLVKKGLATVLAGTALNFLFPGSGAKTTAGGFALIAAGAALSLGSGVVSGLGKGSSGSGGSSSGFNSNPIPLASGALAFGPTNALIGEYSGARNNPEVVAPLNKLKGMLGNTGSNITVIPIANRRELAIMVKEGNEDLSRR